MMNILAFLLLITAGQAAGGTPETTAQPAQRRDAGLWIGGIFFAPDDIASATQEWDSLDGSPNVLITFTETGRAKFNRAQQGRVGEQLEIRMNGEIVSAPILREPISGNQVTISGAFTLDEAEAMARRIAPPRRP